MAVIIAGNLASTAPSLSLSRSLSLSLSLVENRYLVFKKDLEEYLHQA